MPAKWWPLLAVLVFVLGCQQSTVADDVEEESDDVEEEQGEVAQEDPCEIDDDCDTYYRCIDEVCSMPPAMTGEVTEDTPVASFFDEDGQELATFYLELAITLKEQSRGLMHRPEMLDEWGMLFVYAHDQNLSFWMKDTLIPLDMIFINDAGMVVGVVEEAEPETTTSRTVGEPARYVFEINGGLAREKGLERGVTMSLDNVDERFQPSR